MSVIFLADVREARKGQAVSVLKSAVDIELPLDMYVEEGTGAAILTDADWRKLDHLFQAFAVTVPRSLPADRLIDVWFHLTGTLGYELRLAFSNPSLYQTVKQRLPADVQAYLDALLEGDIGRAGILATNLDIVNNCPALAADHRPVLPQRKTDR